jgi:hypothetical protein
MHGPESHGERLPDGAADCTGEFFRRINWLNAPRAFLSMVGNSVF